MQFRRIAMVSLVLMLLLASFAGSALAQDDVVVDQETALFVQDQLLPAIVLAPVTLTDSEASSYLTYALAANAGGLVPVDSIITRFGAGNEVSIDIDLGDGAPIAGPISLSGMLSIDSGKVSVDLSSASIGGYGLIDALLPMVSGVINRALDDPALALGAAGMTVSLSTEDGSVTLALQ